MHGIHEGWADRPREVRQKVVRRSYTHRDFSRSFVRSFLLFLCSCSPSFCPIRSFSFILVLWLLPSIFLRKECTILKFEATELYGAHLMYWIVTYDLDRPDCFFDCELISRAKLLLRSHKRAWRHIEWLVMGVNYVQLYCVCARRIY